MKIFIHRGLSYLGGVLVILVVLGSAVFVMLPTIIKWQANNWFESQGLVSSIDDIEINLTDGQFIIRKLVVNDAAGAIHLNIGYLLVQVALSDLFDKTVTVEKINAGDLYIDTEQNKQGLLKVAGIGVGARPISNNSVTEKSEIESGSTESNPWRFSLAEILINKIKFCYQIEETVSSRNYHSCASLDAFNWNGKANYTLYPGSERAMSQLRAEFSTSAYGFLVNDIQLGRTVVRFDVLNLDDVRVNGINDIQIKQILLEKYFALQEKIAGQASGEADFLLSNNRLVTSNIRFKDLSGLDIDSLHVEGLVASIQVNPDRSLEIQNVLREYSLPEKKTVEQKKATNMEPSEKPIKVRLGELVIGGNSRVAVRDESVTPVYSGQLNNIQLVLSDIDMSDRSGNTRVNLSLVIGEQGEIKTNGSIRLFAEKPTLSLNVRVTGVNIGEFDAYAHNIVQHKIRSGHLDANMDIQIDNGNLDTSSEVTLHKFYVEALDKQEASQYKEKLGIPLSSALSLLRERDDRISIKMPVKGNVENPDFSLADIVRKVSIVAIKEAVINYYTPYGLVKLLTKGFDLATALRFEPVLFDAGQWKIDAQDTEQLDKLAGLLTERPRVHLVICGHATRSDFKTLFPEEARKVKVLLEKKKKQAESENGELPTITGKMDVPIADNTKKMLEELAVTRGKLVKQYLVDQHKIETGRLILCNPVFDYTDSGKMRVEISI